MENSLEIKIGKTTYSYQRPQLKKWVQLDEVHSEIRKATTRKDTQQLANLISEFLVVAFPSSTSDTWLSLDWEVAFGLLSNILSINKIRITLPLIAQNKSEDKKDAWEYKGRSWYYWLNIFAKEYGWTEADISKLEIEDALALVQEIFVGNQLEKEWEWSLTEIAYPYNANTKKNSFKPLQRPSWMMPEPSQPKVIQIRKDMLPQGNIINMADLIPKKVAG